MRFPRPSAATALVLVAIVSLAPALAADDDVDGNVDFLLGQRQLDEDPWAPFDDQDAFGAHVTYAGPDWPVHLAVGIHWSNEEEDYAADSTEARFDDAREVRVGIFEISIGIQKFFNMRGKVRPYVGGGATNVWASIALDEDDDFDFLPFDDTDDRDRSLAFYGNAGVQFRLGSSLNIGFDARLVRGTEGELRGIGESPDYEQVAFAIGFGF